MAITVSGNRNNGVIAGEDVTVDAPGPDTVDVTDSNSETRGPRRQAR